MAADADSGERTEEPTQQRREDFRKKGQVAQTRELASVFMLLGSVLMMWFLGKFFVEQLADVFTHSMTGFLVEAANSGDYRPAVIFAFKKMFMVLLPLFGMFALFSFASSAVQVGFLVNEEALKPKIEKLNPVEGLKRIFSIRSVVEGLKALVKVILVSGLAYLIIRGELVKMPQLIHYSVSQIMAFVGVVSLKLLGFIGGFMAIVAALDFCLLYTSPSPRDPE